MRNLGEDGVVSILKSEEKIIPWKVSVESRRGGNMGNGVCSRKQKKIFQSLLLVTVVFGDDLWWDVFLRDEQTAEEDRRDGCEIPAAPGVSFRSASR